MAQEASVTDQRQHEKDEHNTQLQRMVAEMQAEMQRLAAQAYLGPPIVLDTATGRLTQMEGRPGEGGFEGVPNKGIVSEMETCATAVRVVLADRGYSVRALAANLAASPAMPLAALQSQQRHIQMTASDLDRQLDSLSESLGARPLDVPASQTVLVQTQAGCKASVAKMLAAREQLATSQVEAVGLEECISEGESALRTGASLLAGWASLMGRLMAQGEGVDQATRLRLRDEIRTMEDPLHRASTAMAASQVVGSSMAGQSMAAGDPGMADAVLAVREAQNVMLELAARLPDK
ncbi:hypothetical protein DUNSADRAFT_2729 [Dunaliella salina]|uniref:Uncharacterized protein n=1 Tax=Dunaliella salina TaxID=3046 RepID=A0ABQ7GV89_DUNSA|nr:hypothetical protein DUNSADRAFT_2729 [Dunaliella salina]|eukprot:KAF5838531.1 hypothetical protein DUNSADRAFT_2729 [Dunaliella salina]